MDEVALNDDFPPIENGEYIDWRSVPFSAVEAVTQADPMGLPVVMNRTLPHMHPPLRFSIDA
jgi:hypothetical protein